MSANDRERGNSAGDLWGIAEPASVPQCAPQGTPPGMDLTFADDISGFGPSAMAAGDPRLKYTEKAKEEGKGLDDQKLPYDPNKKGAMNSMEVLKNLTQVDGIEETKTDESRCAANAVLAMAVMKGPGGI